MGDDPLTWAHRQLYAAFQRLRKMEAETVRLARVRDEAASDRLKTLEAIEKESELVEQLKVKLMRAALNNDPETRGSCNRNEVE